MRWQDGAEEVGSGWCGHTARSRVARGASRRQSCKTGAGKAVGGAEAEMGCSACCKRPLRPAIRQHAPRLVVADGLGVCGRGAVAGMGCRAAGGHDQPVPVPYNELLPVCNPRFECFRLAHQSPVQVLRPQ